jgi:TetR/AcrR family transcriptional regulator, transcriptional repressor for nem operon
VKVSKEQVAQNRDALIQAAARLFRERGIDGVGIAEICKQAGLTHGALYAQFRSKEDLAAEALADGTARANGWMTARLEGREPTLTNHLDSYLSSQHRDNLGGGCAMAASASEIARQPRDVSVAFTDGFSELSSIIERSLAKNGSAVERRQRALAITAGMIGAIAAARATAKANPALSDDILVAMRRFLDEVGAEAKPRAKPAHGTRR